MDINGPEKIPVTTNNYVTQGGMVEKRDRLVNNEQVKQYGVNIDNLYQGNVDMQTSAFKNAYTSYDKDYQDLMYNKRVGRVDTDTMVGVKDALGKLNNFFYTEISQKDNVFETQLKDIKALYDDVINKCKEYIKVHPGDRSFWGKGRIRKRMVTNLQARAEAEKKCLEPRAKALKLQYSQANGGDKPTWINVLAEVRTARIDLNTKDINDQPKYKISSVGMNSSTVLKIENKDPNAKDKDKRFYIKKVEHYWSMKAEYEDVVKSKMLVDEGKVKYTPEQMEIMQWLNNVFEGSNQKWEKFRSIVKEGCENFKITYKKRYIIDVIGLDDPLTKTLYLTYIEGKRKKLGRHLNGRTNIKHLKN